MAVQKPAQGKGEYILYLDFDGVLHHEEVYWHPRRGPYLKAPEGHVLFQHLSLLEDVLAPHPAVKIVLSTSWVMQYGFSDAAKRLGPGLRSRVIGATYHSEMRWSATLFSRLPRGVQIWRDVERREPLDWLAVDDAHGEWPDWCRDKLIASDPVLGLSASRVLEELRTKLYVMCGGSNHR
jgi:hypothetical protein